MIAGQRRERREAIRVGTLCAGIVLLLGVMVTALAIGAVPIPLREVLRLFLFSGDADTVRIFILCGYLGLFALRWPVPI